MSPTIPARDYRLIPLPAQMTRRDPATGLHNHGRLTDVDDVKALALAIADAMRDQDPARVATELQAIVHRHPLAATQVMMCLAVLVPIETMNDQDLEAQADLVAHGPEQVVAA